MGDMCDVLRAEVELDCSTKKKKGKKKSEEWWNTLVTFETNGASCVELKHYLATLRKYVSKTEF